MNKLYFTVASLITWGLLSGCADHRIDRSDEEAMMVYRDCMGGMSGQMNVSNMSSTISNSNTVDQNTSIAANVQTQQDQNREIECMRLAGWEQ